MPWRRWRVSRADCIWLAVATQLTTLQRSLGDSDGGLLLADTPLGANESLTAASWFQMANFGPRFGAATLVSGAFIMQFGGSSNSNAAPLNDRWLTMDGGE